MRRSQKIRIGRMVLHGVFYFGGGCALVYLGRSLHTGVRELDTLISCFLRGCGLLFLAVGAAYLIRECCKLAQIRKLTKAGRFVWAKIVDCQDNAVPRVVGDYFYRLTASYTDPSGVDHSFQSLEIYGHGVRELLGKNVRVYTSPDYKHYYVDVGALLGDCVE